MGCIHLRGYYNVHNAYVQTCMFLFIIFHLQEQETLSFIRESLEKSDQLTKGMVRNDQFIYWCVCVSFYIQMQDDQTEITVLYSNICCTHTIICCYIHCKYYFVNFSVLFPVRCPSCPRSRAVLCSWRTPSSRFINRLRICSDCRRTWTELSPVWITSSVIITWLKTRTRSSGKGECDPRLLSSISARRYQSVFSICFCPSLHFCFIHYRYNISTIILNYLHY